MLSATTPPRSDLALATSPLTVAISFRQNKASPSLGSPAGHATDKPEICPSGSFCRAETGFPELCPGGTYCSGGDDVPKVQMWGARALAEGADGERFFFSEAS